MKAERQEKILEIIRNENIETQESLAERLKINGFAVTQATVSRDIKELGLIKIPGMNNMFHYAYPQEINARRMDERLKKYFKEVVVSLNISENLIVIKTQPGGAQGVAAAVDQTGWQEIIGTVGGDDTILVVIKPVQLAESVLNRLERLRRG